MKSHKELEEKYWLAEATLEEEEQLHTLMKANEGEEGLYFKALDLYKNQSVVVKTSKPSRQRYFQYFAYAASICLLLTIGINFWTQEKVVEMEQNISYSDQEVLEITNDALLYVTSKLKSITSK